MESLHSRTWWDFPLVMENLHEIPHESNDLCSVRASMRPLNTIWILALLHYPGYHYHTLSYHYPVTAIEHTQTLIRFYHFTVEGDEFCYMSFMLQDYIYISFVVL